MFFFLQLIPKPKSCMDAAIVWGKIKCQYRTSQIIKGNKKYECTKSPVPKLNSDIQDM